MAKRNRPPRADEVNPREAMWVDKGLFIPGTPLKASEDGWYVPADHPAFDRKAFKKWAKGTAVCGSM